jgi:hypothetical protein
MPQGLTRGKEPMFGALDLDVDSAGLSHGASLRIKGKN